MSEPPLSGPTRKRAGTTPNVHAIAAHRGFADALVAGLIPRYRDAGFGLARLTLLLPSRRAARTVTEAFIRATGQGLLLPRLAVVGDLDLDEALGPLFDTLGEGAELPRAAEPTRRWLRLAAHLAAIDGTQGAAGLRQARAIAGAIDRLLVEGISFQALLDPETLALIGDQAEHWKTSSARFMQVWSRWCADCRESGEVDPPTRRNLLLAAIARRWRETPPPHPVVAAGVTSASPAVAALLRTVAFLPQGAVILPDLDLALDDETWELLGNAGAPREDGDSPFARADAVTHPQYHMKLLLNRMGIARGEVRPWHRAGPAAAPPERSRAISNLFLPPAVSPRWFALDERARRLAGIRLMESEHPGAEAAAIAVLIREALAVPERRVALITPDRGLARRVVGELARGGIDADDSAGRSLSQTAAGRLLLLAAEVMGEGAAPVPLIALLSHPLVRAGASRAAWLEGVRVLDLALRGPRPAPGLAPLAALVQAAASDGRAPRPAFAAWWREVEAMLAPLTESADEDTLSVLLERLVTLAGALCGEAAWDRADGRALAGFVEELRDAAAAVPTPLDRRELAALLRADMDLVAVRPPWGGHPRVAIYGLIEARMSRADCVICGGLVEGVWPAAPAPDPVLPPAALRRLGVPGGDFRIGLAAHDFAGALGAPEVVLSWARRDEAGPVIPSRFVLRVQAMLGSRLAEDHAERRAPALAAALAAAEPAPPCPRPAPLPSAQQRAVAISATGLDRLRSDPYQFYASVILGLKPLDGLDAEPSAALRGEATHAILEAWHKVGGGRPALLRIAGEELERLSAHPLMRALWGPRLLAALDWIGAEVERLAGEGRQVAVVECRGDMVFDGVRVHGRADRIDRLADGSLAIVDYKTGTPPSARMVEMGYSLQLGTLGLIAAAGGFDGVTGTPERFEYWSLAKAKDQFGFRSEPVLEGRKRSGIAREAFLDVTAGFLRDAIDRWIKGDEPFTARLNLDIGGYNDYDQLMRLDEWIWRIDREERTR
ncbi:MAG: double-strand break repair protein AddB [Sphingomonadales bacterium]|nr:double-strand break repair protein AddB [Sphingomonadales bacterium]